MAPRTKRQRGSTGAAAETPVAWTLPVDLILEIIARSEPRTLFRSAAASKILRREILSLSFILRVSHRAAPCILAYLRIYGDKPLTPVYPSTTAVASFCQDYLWRYMSCKTSSLVDKYRFETSRRGLVLLRRRHIKNRLKSDRCSDMCVYDPMSGACTFLPHPPGIKITDNLSNTYVLLTAADGIDCPFLLLVAELRGSTIKVQIASSCGTWGPVTFVEDENIWWCLLKPNCDPAVLRGGLIHWLAMDCGNKILSYDLGTGKTGWMKLPSTKSDIKQLRLATSYDGKVLKLLAVEGFKLSVWLYLPVSEASGSGWSLHTVIDMEAKVRSLDPNITGSHGEYIVFSRSGKRTSDVVLLEVRDLLCRGSYSDELFVFDMETKEMHRQKRGYSLLEIDLPSRLQTMKIFP